MKPSIPNGRTIAIMTLLRRHLNEQSMSRQKFRDILNREFLHDENAISTNTVYTWFDGKSPAPESMLAIQEYLVSVGILTTQTTNQTKPKHGKETKAAR